MRGEIFVDEGGWSVKILKRLRCDAAEMAFSAKKFVCHMQSPGLSLDVPLPIS